MRRGRGGGIRGGGMPRRGLGERRLGERDRDRCRRRGGERDRRRRGLDERCLRRGGERERARRGLGDRELLGERRRRGGERERDLERPMAVQGVAGLPLVEVCGRCGPVALFLPACLLASQAY